MKREDQVAIMEHGIDTLRSIYEHYMHTEDRLKKYSGVLLVAIFTIFTYLTGSQFISLPAMGPIEWGVAAMILASMLAVVRLLIGILFTFSYIPPGDIEKYRDIKRKYKDYPAYLRVMAHDYSECIVEIAATANKHLRWFSACLKFSFLGVFYVLLMRLDVFGLLYQSPLYIQSSAVVAATVLVPNLILLQEIRRFQRGNAKLQERLHEINVTTRPV